MSDAIKYLSSSEQIQANYEKYKDKFEDSAAELVNSETFLNLLVAEMTNQDPLEPTSNTEFVTQMAQFTSLQYAQDSSKYAQANYASSLVGKTVTASKMEGSELVTKTGVVEQVVKSGDTYNIMVGGTSFELSHIASVVTSADSSTGTGNTISTGTSIGDTIARASMMIGMHATVNATTSSGAVIDAGIIDSIQVKNGEINVVINDVAYKLSDIVEVKYPEYGTGTEEKPETEKVPEVGDTSAQPDVIDEKLYEVLDELMADVEIDKDIEDLEDIPDVTEEV